ncbi:helix-turn-helix domain-containing protein [Vibrio amylolyticus]|uniref:helix-turn-helix domain-containing protein n=1 Tax=Vibrio amylolyticus TaxID=2847292 RepID=UPI003D0571BA
MAVEVSPSVFYPLSTQAEGRTIAARNLFLSEQGGIWIHDVHGRVVFYDGKNTLPRRGSVLDFTSDQLVYLDQAFWSFADNEIYRSYPNQQRELVFSLTPGTTIRSIGISKRYIWVADDSNFYTYHIDSGDFQSYSLMELYQSSQSSRVVINDAQLIMSKWVLATNIGVFLSEASQFSHISASGKRYTETLHFSNTRNELVIGSLSGALIVDVFKPDSPLQLIRGHHVLSIVETSKEYWIGTERGLFVYSFETGEITELKGGVSFNYDLEGSKIYSLLNDSRQGIWIGTDQGIRYYSLYSEKFRRIPKHLLTYRSVGESLKKVMKNEDREGYWLVSNHALYRISLQGQPSTTVIYNKSEVFDLIQHQGVLMLATESGIVCIDITTGEVIKEDGLPVSIKEQKVEQLERGYSGMLWGVKGPQLWSYDLEEKSFKNYGDSWMVNHFTPSKVTLLRATESLGLLIGTDHGLYQLKNGRIQFFKESTQFGHVVAIKEVEGFIWVASSYGLYRLSSDDLLPQSIPMIEQNISPKCLLKKSDGVWLTSSAGLSYYDNNANIIKHISAPFGVLNNEFVSSLCDPSNDGIDNLLLGTTNGLIQVGESALIEEPLPSHQVLFSQINVNQKTISLGSKLPTSFTIQYGDSISFLIGIVPWSHNDQLYYRLENKGEWIELEGYQLSFDHLIPGTHTLQVKRTSMIGDSSNVVSQVFTVLEPWYLSRWAIASSVLMTLLFAGLISLWRSRLMSASNKMLKGKVSLKTNQLRHQSRILLTNNQQLRKQLEVRHLIYNQVITSVQDNLNNLARNTQREHSLSSKDVIRLVSKELEILRNAKSNGNGTKQIFDLSLVIESVLSGWKSEFEKSGIGIQFRCNDSDVLVELDNFNLDVVINTLLDSLLARCFKNQEVQIELYIADEMAVMKMMDSGRAFPDLEHYEQVMSMDLSVHNLPSLVSESGGRLSYHISKERNLIEISWPLSLTTISTEDEASTERLHDDSEEVNEADRLWMQKLDNLLEKHYADSDFGTASAAKHLFISERSLQRRFKASHGRTFKEYLNEYRLDKAVKKLLAGEKVSDVAFDCGYNDASYFSQRFKHHFGAPPSQFIGGYEQQDKITE